MNKAAVSGLCVLLLFFTSFAVAKECKEVNIVMIGDSITQGYMRNASRNVYGIKNPVNGANLSVGSYGPDLKSLIRGYSKCSSAKVNAYNWGYAGYRTYQFPALIPGIINKLKSKNSDNSLNYCLVMVGANDLYAAISPSNTKSNTRNIVKACETRGVPVVLASITQNYLYPQINGSYNSQLKTLATEEGVTFVDMYKGMQPWSLYHSGDGLHVEKLGYKKMANVWFSGLKPKIEAELKSNSNSISPILGLLLLQ